MAAAAELNTLFTATRVGPPITAGNIAFVPLLRDSGGPDADLLEESVSKGYTKVREVSELGEVNLVRVKHNGPRMLLLVDGEQILGAKQNRVFNASFLVPPGKAVDIPVSCVERGRWSYGPSPADAPMGEAGPAHFEASETTVASRIRSAKLSRVATSTLDGSRGYDAGQGAVWADVDKYLERSGVNSRTEAYADGYRARAADAEQQLAKLQPVENQIGLAVVHGDKLVSMDLFGSAALYSRAWQRLARGALADVYDKPANDVDAGQLVGSVLQTMADANVARTSAPGCGETLHGATPDAVIGAVTYQGKLYHALAASP